MSSYPRAMSYYLSRLNNFSRQKLRLSTISNTTFRANDQIVIQLPEGLLDLSTFTLQGRSFTSGDGQAHGVYAPFHEGQIDSISVECGGVSIQNGFTNYNDLFNIFRQYQMFDRSSFRKVLQNDSHPNATASNFSHSNVPFAIYNWLGFLGSVKILDTTILPPVKIYIRLAPNSVLTSHQNGGAVLDYKWTDVKATIDILDISDGIYYNMIAQRLAQAPLEIPFDNIQTVTGSLGAVTQTTRWSTSTDCLESVIATMKPVGYDSNTINATTSLSDYFTRGGKATTSAITSSQFSVNGIRYPSIPCMNADGEVFLDTAHTLGVSQDILGQSDPNMDTLAKWSSNYWCHGHSWTYPDAEDSHRLVGLSGKGNQIIGSFETTGFGSNLLPILFLKGKSVLRIGNSKSVELIL